MQIAGGSSQIPAVSNRQSAGTCDDAKRDDAQLALFLTHEQYTVVT